MSRRPDPELALNEARRQFPSVDHHAVLTIQELGTVRVYERGGSWPRVATVFAWRDDDHV